MKFAFTNPATRILNAAQIAAHLRIDDAGSPYVAELIDAATQHAEKAMAMAFINRTVTATFYPGETIRLPLGPVASLTSVTVDGNALTADRYSIEGAGDMIRIGASTIATDETVVVYTAGFGTTADAVPANIKNVVRCHVGALYENRESPVENFEGFYRMYGRDPGCG